MRQRREALHRSHEDEWAGRAAALVSDLATPWPDGLLLVTVDKGPHSPAKLPCGGEGEPRQVDGCIFFLISA